MKFSSLTFRIFSMTSSNLNTQPFDLKPKYFDSLNDEDQQTYQHLQAKLTSKSSYRFPDILDMIQNFCVQGNANDGTRMLVCGICWLPNSAISINLRQFRLLIDKCKSSVSSHLKKLGYAQVPITTTYTFGMMTCDYSSDLIMRIPFLKNNAGDLRDWQIFQLSPSTPEPHCLLLEDMKIKVEDFQKAFLSPTPQIITATSPEEAKVRIDRFDEQADSFFFDDPFCLPPAFIFQEI
ncbi:hypothetical protein TRFO_11428 [Tritrichomonas foetus]|uniref:Initiator binding domain-containing protein n=1 Tax=Tritrichomonas foetus TaxID=1144522 RepID=A0A1J4J3M4_9EUKA|nr:hypothetical protein TRFO_11428 [Tritrichomonas foetus]|eukprot:OHS93962.1 hypothetical protein TRFO_11428 [Tritrichomonas foetus]